MSRTVKLVLAVFVCGFVGFWLLTSPMLQTVGLGSVPAGEPNLANGRNLFFAGHCTSCHASPDQSDPFRLGGGRPLRFGTIGLFYPPNISPNPRFGIGSWSARQFLQALRTGVSPDGRHYFPVFPYTSYARMNVSDIRDLYAFLKTLPPVASQPAPDEILFPFRFRRAIGLWKLLFFDRSEFKRDPTKTANWNRGAYLVEFAAQCAECHSTRNVLFAIRPDMRFAGGPNPERPSARIPNITEQDQGLKAWSRSELESFLNGDLFPQISIQAEI